MKDNQQKAQRVLSLAIDGIVFPIAKMSLFEKYSEFVAEEFSEEEAVPFMKSIINNLLFNPNFC